jgi:hypothetical protein
MDLDQRQLNMLPANRRIAFRFLLQSAGTPEGGVLAQAVDCALIGVNGSAAPTFLPTSAYKLRTPSGRQNKFSRREG